jgi:hypothetical protein
MLTPERAHAGQSNCRTDTTSLPHWLGLGGWPGRRADRFARPLKPTARAPEPSSQQHSPLGRSTRTRGCSGRTEGANKIRARLIHPSHWLGSTHPRCGPHERRIHRDPPAADGHEPPAQVDQPLVRSARAAGSSRSTTGAIRPSRRLNSINHWCDPPEPPAQLDHQVVRSTQAAGSGGQATE